VFSNGSGCCNEAPGVIDCNHLTDSTAELEREAPDAAAQVERTSALLEWKRDAFAVDTLMKSQQDILEMVQVGAKVFRFPVMKEEILVQVTLRFVRVAFHVATCFTKSVGW
jgi:hypothetical protein